MRLQGDLQLRPAIAAQAVKDVAGQALRVDAHEGRRAVGEFAHLQDDGFLGAVACGGLEIRRSESTPNAVGKSASATFVEPNRASGLSHASY